MRELRKAKWLTAGGGMVCLATFLALGLHLSGTPVARIGAPSQVSRGAASASAPVVRTSTRENLSVARHYAQLPLGFEPVGPASNSPAKFLARGNGYALFLANREAVLELRGPSHRSAVVRMQLAGANTAPAFTALETLPGKSNYFIGNDPSKWRRNVPQYRRLLESNIYRGVNLVYYGVQGQMEYDFDVAPGIDPSVIQLAFRGASDVRVDALGELVIDSPGGEIRLRKPIAYQEIAGNRQPVSVGYVLKNKKSVSFEVAAYDARKPLVIDPVLIYSTYLGGSNIEGANSIAVAPDKTAFIAGSTFSSDFPTIHALQPNEGGGPDHPQDGFVAKISADGSTLLYATYLGGKSQDAANGIAVDNFGNAYVTGTTLSPDFPVGPETFNSLCGGDGKCGASWNTLGLKVTNAFVVKLNAAGSNLLYSGFLGEYENVAGQGIAVDSNFNAYVTGQTTANGVPTVLIVPPATPPPPFPITASAFQPAFGGGNFNAFVTKIDATGATILYSSYLGGNIEDVGYGIAADAHANAYVTGLTYSTTFPTTAPLQAANAGAGDAFISKVNTNASGAASLVYSTFLGGAGLDQGNAIAVDTLGNAYIGGQTNSASFAFTPAGVQPTYGGEGDAFVAKLNAAGTLSYFTYLGGTKADSSTGIAVDSAGNAYVTGSTVSTDFPTSGSVFQAAYGGGNADSFVAKLDALGATLLYSSYLGGTNTELASAIAVDTDGSAYVTGQTCSQDFPLANPLQSVPGGNCDAYVAKVSILAGFDFSPAGLVFSAQSLHTTSQTQTITLTNGDNPQTITSIALTGANAGDFADTTTCGPPLAVGAKCTLSVTFTPSGAGIRKAQIIVTDSAPGSPHVVNLTGNTSAVTLSSSSLSFGLQAVGIPSAVQSVTVTNSGSDPLTISSITASGDFSEGNNCTLATLQPSTNCEIDVVFDPAAAVASVGAITITDSGAGSPQVILATGTGVLQPAFQVSSLTGTPAVPAGTTAKYAISVTSASGFSQSVALSCSAPATLTCSVSPSLVVPTSAQSQLATLTVSSALRTIAPPAFGIKLDPPAFLRRFDGTWLLWLVAALLAITAATLRRRPITAAFGFAVVLLLASVACGGSAPGVPAGTPAGMYQVTVTGTSGSVNDSIPLSLQVK